MSDEKPMNIHQRLHAVMKEIKYIKKDVTVGSGSWGYKGVGHDSVTAMVRPAFLEHGILVTTSLVESSVTPTGTMTGKGTPIIRYQGRYEMIFANIDEPTDRIPIVVEAHANDEGDKAPGKAMSYATKLGLLKTLNLETGIGDEGRIQEQSNGDGEKKEPIKQPQSKSEKAATTAGPTKASVDAEKASPGLITMIKKYAKEKDVVGAIDKQLAAKEKTYETLNKTEAGLLLKWVKELKVEAASA